MPDSGAQQGSSQGGQPDQLQFSTELKVVLPAIGSDPVDDQRVHSVLVEQDMNQPDMCQVTLDDSDWTYSKDVKIGDGVKIQFGRKGEGDTTDVFDGEVVAVEPKFSSDGESLCVIRAFDRLHRLVRGRKSRTFENMTESDIVQQIASGNGLRAECDVSETQVHVYQHNQTDLEFLLHRARIHGAHVYVEGEQLFFRTPDHERDYESDIALELKDGAEYRLKKFSPRMSSADVLSAVEVRGWDPVKKEEIVYRATPENSSLGHGKLGDFLAPEASGDFGKEVSFSVDSPSFSLEEAQSKAESLLYDSMMDFITGTGVVVGRSALSAGQVVDVKLYLGGGEYDPSYRFNGRYLLTGVSHRYTREKSGNFGGYLSMIRFRRDAHAKAEEGGEA